MTITEYARVAHEAGAIFLKTVDVIAAESTPAPAPVINTEGIVAAITKYVVPILLAVLGVTFISRAGKGEMSRVLTSSAIAIIGIGFIAGATLLFLFGKNLVNLILGGSQ